MQLALVQEDGRSEKVNAVMGTRCTLAVDQVYENRMKETRMDEGNGMRYQIAKHKDAIVNEWIMKICYMLSNLCHS